ncbi:hypothetical protein [Halospeciosus flavus]|uniref:Lipoprotein n=1 Tax=Halospeciosus flavus TaxID=3032283 RepID=A0ABD5Z811_9EURY|nr:hypothetical protein [Halospeciosus flavus]
MPSRRTVLAGVVGPTVGSAGCLGVGATDPPHGETWLADYHVYSLHAEAHTVDVAVRLDGEQVHRESYDVAAYDGDGTVENGTGYVNDWPRRQGRFVVTARLDDGPTRHFDSAASYERDVPCTRVGIRVDETGRLGIWTTTNCDDLDTTPPTDE